MTNHESQDGPVQIKIIPGNGEWAPTDIPHENHVDGGEREFYLPLLEKSPFHLEPGLEDIHKVINGRWGFKVELMPYGRDANWGWWVAFQSEGGGGEEVFFPQTAVSWGHPASVGSDGERYRGQFMETEKGYVIGLIRERTADERKNGEPQVDVPDYSTTKKWLRRSPAQKWLRKFKRSRLFVKVDD